MAAGCPAYASSLGRAILAFLPEDEAQAILDRSDLQPITSRTMVDPRRLRAELRRVHTRGYVVNDQEIADGLRGVAAPILGASQRPIAALNISIPRPLNSPDRDRNVLGPRSDGNRARDERAREPIVHRVTGRMLDTAMRSPQHQFLVELPSHAVVAGMSLIVFVLDRREPRPECC